MDQRRGDVFAGLCVTAIHHARRSRFAPCLEYAEERVSFWLDLRCSGGTAERRETACRRQPAGRCKASATPLRVLPPPSRLGQAKNPAATRHFVIFSQVLLHFVYSVPSYKKAGLTSLVSLTQRNWFSKGEETV